MELERAFENLLVPGWPRSPPRNEKVCPLLPQLAPGKLRRPTTAVLTVVWPRFSTTPQRSSPTRVTRALRCATSRASVASRWPVLLLLQVEGKPALHHPAPHLHH